MAGLSLASAACLASKPVTAVPLQVWAASSLTRALTALGSDWTRDRPESVIEHVFGSSRHLVLQLGNGAPGDVLATADRLQVQLGIDKGLILTDSVRLLARNALGLAVHPRAADRVAGLSDLVQPDLRLAWARSGVPLAGYVEQMLEQWQALQEDSTLSALIRRNILSYDSNAGSVRNRLVLGEADAAILYVSDMLTLPAEFRQVSLPPELSVSTELYAMPLRQSSQPDLAAAYISFLTGPIGRARLTEHGFEAPHPAQA